MASRKGLSDAEILSEWTLYATSEDSTCSSDCVCGKKGSGKRFSKGSSRYPSRLVKTELVSKATYIEDSLYSFAAKVCYVMIAEQNQIGSQEIERNYFKCILALLFADMIW